MAYFRILKKTFPETSSTLPETNITPLTPWLEDELVSFGEGLMPGVILVFGSVTFQFKQTFQSIPAPEGTETWALALQG